MSASPDSTLGRIAQSTVNRHSGYQMIRSIEIKNFRCYADLTIPDCKRLNLIVGENGSGKTALLESIFMPLAPTSEMAMRYRQQRGMDGTLQGTRNRIEEAIWGDLFHNNDSKKPISLRLSGDGEEARSVVISRGGYDQQTSFLEADGTEGFVMEWVDANGKPHTLRPRVNPGMMPPLPETGEDMPNFFYFSANGIVSAAENAARFSDLSIMQQQSNFVETFTKEYPWIEDISIEIAGGTVALFAALKGQKRKRSLPMLSGGINRVAGILVAIASRPESVVLIDELENGIFYAHHAAVWRRLLSFMRDNNSQLFITTHSLEFIKALMIAAGKDTSDIALWRARRGKDGAQHFVQQYSGKDLAAGVRLETDVR